MNPQVGDIIKGVDLGFKRPYCKYIWTSCQKCGKQRWVRMLKGYPDGMRCRHCNGARSGELNAGWKGGRSHDNGYIQIKLQPDDFFYSMARDNGYAAEHRLVMAKSLGRCLQPWEIVHHKNGIKTDNRRENLDLTMGFNHMAQHKMEYRIKQLEARVTLLEAENIMLRTSAKDVEA